MMKNKDLSTDERSIEIIERADFLDIEDFKKQTVHDDQYFLDINNALLDKGTILLQGPRGCGKTHLMKYAWLVCQDDNKKPLALYVTFNKYFWLEPLLKTKPNAISLFNTWCLTKILVSAYEVFESLKTDICESKIHNILISSKGEFENIINRLEKGLAPTQEQESITSRISVSSVTKSIHELTQILGRKRAIILLDDAAISLTPDYLYEFFDIVRTLKTSKIALKASVYPGTTEYGPKFHVAHEARVVSAWLDIQNTRYSTILDKIAKVRFKGLANIDRNIIELLKYASFGIPRSFLTMLRDYSLSESNTNQQKFNQTVEQFCHVRVSEYLSLKDKLTRLESIIDKGNILFMNMIDKIKDVNTKIAVAHNKQVILGIEEYQNPLASRMLQLLIEVGLIFPLINISHGENRTYERYIPHYAFLLNSKVFSENSRGFNAEKILVYINRTNAKHPVRTKLELLLGKDNYNDLHLNLPACSQCGTPRVNDSQKFCTHCGGQLIDESVFNKCMKIRLSDVPGLTEWQQDKIQKLTIKNVGEFLTLPDPGSELRKIRNIGPKRAEKMITKISLHVDEYLS